MTPTTPDPTPAAAPADLELHTALATLRDAYNDVEHLLATRKPAHAYTGLTTLADHLRQLTTRAAATRAQAAAHLHRQEGISIGQLGARLGVSKARAAQLLHAAARHDNDPPRIATAHAALAGSPRTP